jgi:uncharacterized paraquat-inducible protein A
MRELSRSLPVSLSLKHSPMPLSFLSDHLSAIRETAVTSIPENIVACPDCDLLQRIPALPLGGGTARCLRCGNSIASSKPDSLERTLALTVAAAILLVIANVMPLMGLSAVGRQASTTIIALVYLLITIQFRSIRRRQASTTHVRGTWRRCDVFRGSRCDDHARG